METTTKRYGPVIPPRWSYEIEDGTTLRHRDKLREVRHAKGYKNSDRSKQQTDRGEAIVAFQNDEPEFMRDPGHA